LSRYPSSATSHIAPQMSGRDVVCYVCAAFADGHKVIEREGHRSSSGQLRNGLFADVAPRAVTPKDRGVVDALGHRCSLAGVAPPTVFARVHTVLVHARESIPARALWIVSVASFLLSRLSIATVICETGEPSLLSSLWRVRSAFALLSRITCATVTVAGRDCIRLAARTNLHTPFYYAGVV
jgi:hypothetical protein